MFPLRLFAKGLKKEDYFAQVIIGYSFISAFMVQIADAMPLENQTAWSKIFNLYMNSNKSLAREELEKLAEEHAEKSI